MEDMPQRREEGSVWSKVEQGEARWSKVEQGGRWRKEGKRVEEGRKGSVWSKVEQGGRWRKEGKGWKERKKGRKESLTSLSRENKII